MLTLPIARGFLSPVASASDTALPKRIYEDILAVSTPFIINYFYFVTSGNHKHMYLTKMLIRDIILASKALQKP